MIRLTGAGSSHRFSGGLIAIHIVPYLTRGAQRLLCCLFFVQIRGTGAEVLGDPLNALTFLANFLSRQGITLKRGEIVSTGERE